MRRTVPFLLLLLMASLLGAEVSYQSVSATATSQTVYLTTPRSNILICNEGANEAYYRIFVEGDTVAAATTANIMLPSGSATAPYCKTYGHVLTLPAYYKAVSVVCDTAETATVTIESQ